MTISTAAVQGIQSAESLLDRTAVHIANQPRAVGSAGDELSLSSDALALLQAQTQVASAVRVLNADSNLQKTLIDIAG